MRGPEAQLRRGVGGAKHDETCKMIMFRYLCVKMRVVSVNTRHFLQTIFCIRRAICRSSGGFFLSEIRSAIWRQNNTRHADKNSATEATALGENHCDPSKLKHSNASILTRITRAILVKISVLKCVNLLGSQWLNKHVVYAAEFFSVKTARTKRWPRDHRFSAPLGTPETP